MPHNNDYPDRITLTDRGLKPLDSGEYEFPAHSITLLSWQM